MNTLASSSASTRGESPTQMRSSHAEPERAAPTLDPALALWREWSIAHQRTLVLIRGLSALETDLHAAASSSRKVGNDGAQESRVELVRGNLEAAIAEERRLAARIAETDAFSLSGVAGKIAVIILAGETRPCDEDPPWPELRSVLTDLARLGAPDAGALLS